MLNMDWEQPKYTKYEINDAGNILANDNSSEEEKNSSIIPLGPGNGGGMNNR